MSVRWIAAAATAVTLTLAAGQAFAQQEIRVCLSKDLRPMGCGGDVHTQCRSGPTRVPGVK